MTFWTNDKLREAFSGGVVHPFDPSRIKQAAYEMGVASDYAITTPEGEGKRERAEGANDIKIPPGQFALLLTDEILKMPSNAMGFVSVKATWKLKGLVNVSGFHVDPGFWGHVKFSVYNASGRVIYIQPKRPLFQVWLNGLIEELPEQSLYQNKHPPETGILDEDMAYIGGMVASPAGLSDRIDNLSDRFTNALSALEATVRSSITEGDGKLERQLAEQVRSLSVEVASLRTHKNIQWSAIAGLGAALVAILLVGPLGDWLKSKTNTGAQSPALTQPVGSTYADAGVLADSAIADSRAPSPDSGVNAP